MRSLCNVLWFLVGVLLVSAPMFAFAMGESAGWYHSLTGNGPFATATLACQSLNATDYAGSFISSPGGTPDQTAACYTASGGADYGAWHYTVSVPPVDCSSGKPTSFWFDTGPVGPGVSKVPTNDGFCGLSRLQADGTKAGFSSCHNSTSDPATAHVMCYWVGSRDGTKAPSDAAAPAPAPTPDTPTTPVPVKVQGESNANCPAGTSLVGYDSSNIPMCVGMGTDPGKAPSTVGTSPTVTKTNPDGSTTTVDSTASTNSDGSQTTRTATCTVATNGGKSCTTTTATGNTPTGVQGKSDTDPKTGDDTKGDNPAGLDGDLYGKGTKTMQDVMNHWTTAVSGAPFITAAQGFLGANVNGGACPSWTADVAYLKTGINLGQYFCAPGTEAIFGYIGIGVMLGAAFLAFKIAFL